MVQIPSSIPQNSTQSAAVTTFTQDRQIRFSQGQQLVTKLVTAPVACGAVMVPSTMLMGQVVTAYPTFATQQQQSQTLSVTPPQPPPPSSQEQQLTSVPQPSQAPLAQPPQQFLQCSGVKQYCMTHLFFRLLGCCMETLRLSSSSLLRFHYNRAPSLRRITSNTSLSNSSSSVGTGLTA
ncbi:Circadian locomoter output cycles protein kaput [Tupaia chinensis]|uniref:Circadian locomoter output cycles protein kaput n=1 Tax=Tupaia chinensis TaxID=246437 RepID=L8Y7Z1_TUPCH|nr:Circadian locomoter output cycles protein kaput [Tupaia chinensis]